MALAEAGGVSAPGERAGQLRALLLEELRAGAAELRLTRSGYRRPVAVAIGPGGPGLLAVVPVDPMLRADAASVREREWLLTAAVVGALVDVGAPARERSGSGAPGRARARSASAARGLAPAHAGDGPFSLAARAGGGRALGLARASGCRSAPRMRSKRPSWRRSRSRTTPRRSTGCAPVPTQFRRPSVLEGVADLRGADWHGRPAPGRRGGGAIDAGPRTSAWCPSTKSCARRAEPGAAAARPDEELDPDRVARRISSGWREWARGGYHTEFEALSRGYPPRSALWSRSWSG